jgi:hypothetical protein
MAVQTAATSVSGQGIIKIFTFTSVSDTDTFTGPASPKAFWAAMIGNPSTQASAGIAVTESAGTYTFYPGENSLGVTLFVVC